MNKPDETTAPTNQPPPPSPELQKLLDTPIAEGDEHLQNLSPYASFDEVVSAMTLSLERRTS